MRVILEERSENYYLLFTSQISLIVHSGNEIPYGYTSVPAKRLFSKTRIQI